MMKLRVSSLTSKTVFLPSDGIILAQRYQVVETLPWQGQSAIMIKAKDVINADKQVVIKALHSRKNYFQIGCQEAHILNQLGCADPHGFSHTIRLQNLFLLDGHFCLVFEALDPRPITRVMSNLHLSSEQMLRALRKLILQLLQAVGFLKQNNIIHADLKPANILLRNARDLNSVQVIDFGNAIRQVHQEMSIYYSDFELQSLIYRAPEVWFGIPFGTEIDMWSLGCILAEIYLGQPLIYGTSKMSVLQAMVDILGPLPQEVFLHGKFYKELQQFTQKNVDESDVVVRLLERFGRNSQADYTFFSLISGLLKYDPGERLTPHEAALHPFLAPEICLFYLMPQTGLCQKSMSTIFNSTSTYKHSTRISRLIKQQQHPSPVDLLHMGTGSSSHLPCVVIPGSPELSSGMQDCHSLKPQAYFSLREPCFSRGVNQPDCCEKPSTGQIVLEVKETDLITGDIFRQINDGRSPEKNTLAAKSFDVGHSHLESSSAPACVEAGRKQQLLGVSESRLSAPLLSGNPFSSEFQSGDSCPLPSLSDRKSAKSTLLGQDIEQVVTNRERNEARSICSDHRTNGLSKSCRTGFAISHTDVFGTAVGSRRIVIQNSSERGGVRQCHDDDGIGHCSQNSGIRQYTSFKNLDRLCTQHIDGTKQCTPSQGVVRQCTSREAEDADLSDAYITADEGNFGENETAVFNGRQNGSDLLTFYPKQLDQSSSGTAKDDEHIKDATVGCSWVRNKRGKTLSSECKQRESSVSAGPVPFSSYQHCRDAVFSADLITRNYMQKKESHDVLDSETRTQQPEGTLVIGELECFRVGQCVLGQEDQLQGSPSCICPETSEVADTNSTSVSCQVPSSSQQQCGYSYANQCCKGTSSGQLALKPSDRCLRCMHNLKRRRHKCTSCICDSATAAAWQKNTHRDSCFTWNSLARCHQKANMGNQSIRTTSGEKRGVHFCDLDHTSQFFVQNTDHKLSGNYMNLATSFHCKVDVGSETGHGRADGKFFADDEICAHKHKRQRSSFSTKNGKISIKHYQKTNRNFAKEIHTLPSVELESLSTCHESPAKTLVMQDSFVQTERVTALPELSVEPCKCKDETLAERQKNNFNDEEKLCGLSSKKKLYKQQRKMNVSKIRNQSLARYKIGKLDQTELITSRQKSGVKILEPRNKNRFRKRLSFGDISFRTECPKNNCTEIMTSDIGFNIFASCSERKKVKQDIANQQLRARRNCKGNRSQLPVKPAYSQTPAHDRYLQLGLSCSKKTHLEEANGNCNEQAKETFSQTEVDCENHCDLGKLRMMTPCDSGPSSKRYLKISSLLVKAKAAESHQCSISESVFEGTSDDEINLL